jgi:hypothetical protein
MIFWMFYFFAPGKLKQNERKTDDPDCREEIPEGLRNSSIEKQ